jgi:type II secretory pathway pseudopilin PulG
MERRDEQGYALIAVVVMVFLVMLALGVAAPRVAKQLRRENEVEAKQRGDQYTRAIRVFYRKNGSHYPSSIEQMEKTNNVRYLRQRYVDPITGKDDWRLIHLGETKTTVKGFFGQPLAGLATQNIGSTAGLSTPGTPIGASSSAIGGTAGASGSSSAFGQSSSSGFGSSSSAFGSSTSSGFGASSNTAAGAAGAGAAGGSTAAGTGTSTSTSTSGSQPLGTNGPIVGIGTGATGDSILDLNEQTSYETWEFVYDPRIEQLYAKANLMGGAGSSAGGLGNGGSSIAPNNPNGPNQSSPFGNSPNSPGSSSPFGSSPSSPGSSSPFGSSPSSPGSSPYGPSPTR